MIGYTNLRSICINVITIKKILRMKKLNSVNTNKEKILIITFLLSNDGSHNSNFSVVKLNKNRHFIFNLYLFSIFIYQEPVLVLLTIFIECFIINSLTLSIISKIV